MWGGAAAIGRGKRGREAREEGGAAARKQAEPQAAVSLFLLGAFQKINHRHRRYLLGGFFFF